jgi:hypothetical protein
VQVQVEADTAVIRAKGEAEAIKVRGEALKLNPAFLRLQIVERWNGKSPLVVPADVNNTGADLNVSSVGITGGLVAHVRSPGTFTALFLLDALTFLGYVSARKDDTRHVHAWEVAGTSHADAYMLVDGPSDLGRSPGIVGLVVTATPLPGIIDCGLPINSGPEHFVLNAAFAALDREIIMRVVDKFLMQLEAQLSEKKVEALFTEELKKYLAKHGFDPLMGARPMARLIQDTIRRALADELLFGRLVDGGRLTVDVDAEGHTVLDIQPLPKREGKAKPEPLSLRKDRPTRKAGDTF